MLMLVLIVAAAACLAAGLLRAAMPLVWAALGASVLGVVLLGFLLYVGRRSSGAETGTGADPAESGPAAPDAAGHSGEATPATGDRAVHVLPGRRRFHVEGCEALAGRSAEEIGLDEAREEGFTACTSCIPDREALPSPR